MAGHLIVGLGRRHRGGALLRVHRVGHRRFDPLPLGRQRPDWHQADLGSRSRYGGFALGETLDNFGPMCRSAKDAAAMLGAIAGHDRKDPTSLRAEVPDYLDGIEDG